MRRPRKGLPSQYRARKLVTPSEKPSARARIGRPRVTAIGGAGLSSFFTHRPERRRRRAAFRPIDYFGGSENVGVARIFAGDGATGRTAALFVVRLPDRRTARCRDGAPARYLRRGRPVADLRVRFVRAHPAGPPRRRALRGTPGRPVLACPARAAATRPCALRPSRALAGPARRSNRRGSSCRRGCVPRRYRAADGA